MSGEEKKKVPVVSVVSVPDEFVGGSGKASKLFLAWALKKIEKVEKGEDPYVDIREVERELEGG